MTADLLKPPSAELKALVGRAAHYAESTIADVTARNYAADFRHFRIWAEARALFSMPPDVATVAVYLAALADGNVENHWVDRSGSPRVHKVACKYGTIQKCYQGIVHEIRKAGHEWPHAIPAITKVLHGIKYRKGDTKKRVAPLEAEAAGLDPDRFAGHSLRAGFVTTAAARGVTLHNIMRQTRHKDQRVAMSYIRPATVFRDNATDGLGDETEPKR